jgi:membrane-bound lytic murein transglycosylase MltF
MRKEARNVVSWVIRLLLLAATVSAMVAAEAKPVEKIIQRKAKKHGIRPKLLYAIACVESRLRPTAVGTKDDRGLFQLRERYFGERASFDPVVNADAAAAYLAWLKERPACAKHGRFYYACFNRGPNGIAKLTLDEVASLEYVKRVEAVRSSGYCAGAT